jgi:hypothetical protein
VRSGSGGRGGEGGRGGGGAFAQGTGICVCVLLQDQDQRSALHYASMKGLESTVAKLLSLGADAALKDRVRACSYTNTFMYSVHVYILYVHVCLCVSVCVDTHKDMRIYEMLTLTFVPAHAHHAHGRIHACTDKNVYKCMCVSACEGRNERERERERVCVRERERVRMCVCVCVQLCACMCAWVCVHTLMLPMQYVCLQCSMYRF